MKVTNEVKEAIVKWLEDTGLSQSDAAAELGITRVSFNRYLTIEGRGIRPAQWAKLQVILKKYMNPSNSVEDIPPAIYPAYMYLKSLMDGPNAAVAVKLAEKQLESLAESFQELNEVSKEA